MLKALTVWYLLHKTFKVEAAPSGADSRGGGWHRFACVPMGEGDGCPRLGTVGSKAKAELALANGCDHVILYNEEDFVARVKQSAATNYATSSMMVSANPHFGIAVLPQAAWDVRELR